MDLITHIALPSSQAPAVEESQTSMPVSDGLMHPAVLGLQDITDASREVLNICRARDASKLRPTQITLAETAYNALLDSILEQGENGKEDCVPYGREIATLQGNTVLIIQVKRGDAQQYEIAKMAIRWREIDRMETLDLREWTAGINTYSSAPIETPQRRPSIAQSDLLSRSRIEGSVAAGNSMAAQGVDASGDQPETHDDAGIQQQHKLFMNSIRNERWGDQGYMIPKFLAHLQSKNIAIQSLISSARADPLRPEALESEINSAVASKKVASGTLAVFNRALELKMLTPHQIKALLRSASHRELMDKHVRNNFPRAYESFIHTLFKKLESENIEFRSLLNDLPQLHARVQGYIDTGSINEGIRAALNTCFDVAMPNVTGRREITVREHRTLMKTFPHNISQSDRVNIRAFLHYLEQENRAERFFSVFRHSDSRNQIFAKIFKDNHLDGRTGDALNRVFNLELVAEDAIG